MYQYKLKEIEVGDTEIIRGKKSTVTDIDPVTGGITWDVVDAADFSSVYKALSKAKDFLDDLDNKSEKTKMDPVIDKLAADIADLFNEFRTHVRKKYPEEYERVKRLKESINEQLDPLILESINNDIRIIEEGIGDMIKKGKDAVVKFIMEKVFPLIKKIISGIASGAKWVYNGMIKFMSMIQNFCDKYKWLCRIALVLVVMLAYAFFNQIGAQDPGTMNYNKASLDAMVGILNKAQQMGKLADVSNFDIMQAKIYLKDLQDGNLTASADYTDVVKNLASSAESMFSSIMKDTKSSDPTVSDTAISSILDYLQSGKDTIMTRMGQVVKEMSTTGGGAGAASFTPGTGMQYATPYAFRLKGKKPNIKSYKELGYKEVKENIGATLGPGPKASSDGVKDSAYVKQFKYKLVPKKIKGSGLEVKQLFEDDTPQAKFQKKRVDAFNVIEKELNDIYKMISNAKDETLDYYKDNPSSYAIVKSTDLVIDYLRDIKSLLKIQ